MFEGRKFWETVILVDIYGISSDEEGEEIFAFMEKLVTPVKTIKHRFSPQGLTCVSILAESHMALHTYPEISVATITLSSCSEDGYEELLSKLLDFLRRKGYTYSYEMKQRGKHGIKCLSAGDCYRQHLV